MIRSFREYPPILQKQILIRLAAGIAAYMMILIMWLCNGGLDLMLPFICFGTVFLINAVQLYARCEVKGYVVIRGICTQVDRTGFRRRLKDIYVQEEQFTVRIVRPAMWISSIHVGDSIMIYLAGNAPVYEMEGCKVVYHPLAMEKAPIQTEKSKFNASD